MAVHLHSRGNRGKRSRAHLMSEINVTPMVDVMLVLLIIFMVAAPLLNPGVPVDLPDAAARPLPDDNKPIEITVDQNGAIFIGDTPIRQAELVARLVAMTQGRADARIYLRGDQSLSYGRIMAIIGVINVAGFRRVSLVTEAPS